MILGKISSNIFRANSIFKRSYVTAKIKDAIEGIQGALASKFSKVEEEVDPSKPIPVKIYRYDPDGNEAPYMQDYEVIPENVGVLMLDVLVHIKNDIDPTLTFRRSCREGICGSCAMNVNGVNCLPCITPIPMKKGPIVVYPLPHTYVIKDLVVDMDRFFEFYGTIKPYLMRKVEEPPGQRQLLQSLRDREKLDGLIECILCSCCSHSCPAYWWHGAEEDNFLGPATLLQAYRWIIDSRDEKHKERLAMLNNGHYAFKCHTIFNCSVACPKGLNPAKHIATLKRMLANLETKEEPDMENPPLALEDKKEGVAKGDEECKDY